MRHNVFFQSVKASQYWSHFFFFNKGINQMNSHQKDCWNVKVVSLVVCAWKTSFVLYNCCRNCLLFQGLMFPLKNNWLPSSVLEWKDNENALFYLQTMLMRKSWKRSSKVILSLWSFSFSCWEELSSAFPDLSHLFKVCYQISYYPIVTFPHKFKQTMWCFLSRNHTDQ